MMKAQKALGNRTPAAPLRCHLMETTRGRARNADDGFYFNVALVARRPRRAGHKLARECHVDCP